MIKDSGERTVFASGAVRDMHEGKGRFDLTPLRELKELFERENKLFRNLTPSIDEKDIIYISAYDTLSYIQDSINSENTDYLGINFNAIDAAAYIARYLIDTGKYDNIYNIAIDVSKHYENGAKKYGEHNWEKGIALTSYLDSATRHFTKHLAGHDDEPHDIAAIWNLLGLSWTAKKMYFDNKKKIQTSTTEDRESTFNEKYKHIIECVDSALMMQYDIRVHYLGIDILTTEDGKEGASIEVEGPGASPKIRLTLSYDDMNNVNKMEKTPLSDTVLNKYIYNTISTFAEIYKTKFKDLDDYDIFISVGPEADLYMVAKLEIALKGNTTPKAMVVTPVTPGVFDMNDFVSSLESTLSVAVS